MNSLYTQKQQFRQELRQKIQKLVKEEQLECSNHICSRLLEHPHIKESQVIIGFYPVLNEVNVLPFLQAAHQEKKKIALPCLSQEVGFLIFREVQDWDNLLVNELRIPQPSNHAPLVEL